MTVGLLGYQAIPELLRRAGLDVMFSVLGGTNVTWIAEGVRTGSLRLIKTRHEETTINAAVGYGKSTGDVGVCSVTRGPGFANSINALIAAVRSHYPVLLIVGESPSSQTKTAQNVDQKAFTELIGAGFHHVATPDQLEDTFWEALLDARWNGTAQVLSIGDGVIEATVELGDDTAPRTRPLDVPDAGSIEASVGLLHGASRPLILAGQGAVLADCRADLEELAALSGARLASTLNANRYFSGHPHDLGVCGTWSSPLSQDVIAASDVVLAVGASLNRFTTADRSAFAAAKVIHCEIDADQPLMASRPEYALLGDARATVRALIDEWTSRGLKAKAAPTATPTWDENRARLLTADIGSDPARGIDPRAVLDHIDRTFSSDRIVVTDSGRSQGAPAPGVIDARDGRSWLVGNSFGSLGRGLGCAVGAAVAHPDRPVALIVGDCGFMMSKDLDAIRLNDVSLTVFIMNDEQFGAEVTHLTRHDLSLDLIRQSIPDIPSLAELYGGQGFVVTTQDELDSLVLPGTGLVLVDVRIDPEVNMRAAIG